MVFRLSLIFVVFGQESYSNRKGTLIQHFLLASCTLFFPVDLSSWSSSGWKLINSSDRVLTASDDVMKFQPTPKPRIQNVFLMSRGMSQCVGWFWKNWILWFILQSLTQSKTFRRRRATWARTSPSRSSSSPTQPPPRSSGSLSSQPNQVQVSSTKRDSFSRRP